MVKDHTGQEFNTIREMAMHYGMAERTFNTRIKKMTLEEALTTPVRKTNKGVCKDHLGNEFPSKKAMCEAYGIDRSLFFGRVSIGWSLKDALTTPLVELPPNTKTVTDHTGQTFISVSEMCKHWNMTRVTYNARRKMGWSMEKALTTPLKKIKVQRVVCKDHLGNEYASLNAMCEAYGITRYRYQSRIKLGWTVKDALTKELCVNSTECTDGFGNTFPSFKDLGNYYNIQGYFFQGKHYSEDDTKQLIIKQMKKGKTYGNITIIKPISFPYYHVDNNGKEIIMTFDQILDAYHNSDAFSPIPERKITKQSIATTELIEFPYYTVSMNDTDVVMSYWDIIKQVKESNFGLSERNALH